MSLKESNYRHLGVALITGAGGGIGTAITIKLLETRFIVCATDINEENLIRLRNTVSDKKHTDNLFAFTMDVCDRNSINKVEQIVSDKWGSVNILVNCAGIFKMQPFLEISDDSFGEVIEVNLLGTFRVSQVFVRKMVNNGGGKIINVASASALFGPSHIAAYCASKAGIIALSKSMAKEFANKNIQVNVILPSYIDTPMNDPYKQSIKLSTALHIPSKRIGQPWEVAEVVTYLATCKSSYLTGSRIVIDGGFGLG